MSRPFICYSPILGCYTPIVKVLPSFLPCPLLLRFNRLHRRTIERASPGPRLSTLALQYSLVRVVEEGAVKLFVCMYSEPLLHTFSATTAADAGLSAPENQAAVVRALLLRQGHESKCGC